MTKNRIYLRAIAAGAATMIAGSAMASPVHLNLTNETSNVGGSGYGNAKLYQLMDGDGNLVNVRATAFAFQGADWDTGTHQTAYLGEYSSGLGVTNRGESGYAPGHTLDNAGRADYIVLQFDRAVRPEDVEFTTYRMDGSTDGDLNVFLGNVDTGFNTYIDPTQDFATLSTFLEYDTEYWSGAVNGQSYTRSFEFGETAYGNVVVVAGDLFYRADSPADAFKLKVLNLDVFGPSQSVPAPGMIGLMGIGLAGLGTLRQRKRAAA